MTRPVPLRFAPLIKQTIWGGRRLGTVLNKPIGDADDYAESWEIVDHGQDQSVIQGGVLDGQTLGNVFREQTAWLMGKRWSDRNPDAGSFPLLLKYLDCNQVLSVQVHPDDAYGMTMDPPDLGKTEAWIVLQSMPESVIYAGLKSDVDRGQLAALIESGETEQALHSFHPEPGDCVFIPAGTVHALGGGLLVAEIQQSSNTTFRLFDWNRTDATGKSRELHIESSLAVTDFGRGPVDPIRNSVGTGVEELVSCDKFDLVRLRDIETTVAGDNRCHLLSVIDGTAQLNWIDGAETLNLGNSVLLPAAMSAVHVTIESGCVLSMSPPDASVE